MQSKIISPFKSVLPTFAQCGLLLPSYNSNLHKIALTRYAEAWHGIALICTQQAYFLFLASIGIKTLAFSRNSHCQFKSSDRLGLLTEILP